MPSKQYPFPRIPLAKELPWLKNVSVWSAPPAKRRADVRDAFLVGGDGLISARLGMQERVSTMDRILAPYLSSYNFGENNNFFLDTVQPSRDFYPPFTFTPTAQHIWRVRSSAIIITAERDAQFELLTVNAVHPTLHAVLRYAVLTNLSKVTARDIGISFAASPDVPFPVAGYRGKLEPLSENILETLEELGTEIRDGAPRPTTGFERNRFLIRGAIGAKRRGYADLFVHFEKLKPKESVSAIHYLVPGLSGSCESAIESANRVEQAIAERGIATLLQEVYDFWGDEKRSKSEITTSEPEFTELLENNAVLQKSVEQATGGYVVIDDYTGTWLRDLNGSHRLLLDLGKQEDVRRSMDRYYGLDRSNGTLISCYPSDFEPADPLPPEPNWGDVEQFVTGDVPNFRTLWYAWYFAHTGDLEYIRQRFDYILGAFMRQRLHEHGYLADYCYDETYGIGPVGQMRKGRSCDNSFIALRAAQHLANLATLLGRDDAEYLSDYAAQIHAAIEKTFWLQRKGYYAMRVTPEGKLDETPLSVGLLRPLWTGAFDGDDDHAIRSALYTYRKLYQPNGFLKLIPSHDQTVTMAIGYLLTALKKIGHPDLDRVMGDMLKWADPSGTFGEYLQDSKAGPVQCFEHLAHRSRIWESGLNADALFYTLTGFEPNAVEKKVTLAPYLPKGWKHFQASRLRVGNGDLSLSAERGKRGVRYTIEGISGGTLNIALQLRSGKAISAKVDGKERELDWKKNRFDIYQAVVDLTLQPGEKIRIEL
jgi:hypothetical protein